jgi:hypothetical protein
MLRHILTSLLFILFIAPGTQAYDHDVFNTLLAEHVVPFNNGRATSVDYHGLQQDREILDAYLTGLAEVSKAEFDSWEKAEQLAFLINAYNGWTLKLIVDNYPDLNSIKDLGSLFRSPWKKSFIPLLGETRSLDDIEQGLIRGSGRYNEPRIHFAVNCASIGCPALRDEAYRADRLEGQLEEATRRFLEDRTRNRPATDDTLEISSIFKWYREDFENGWRGAATLEQFLALYGSNLGLDTTQIEKLKKGKYDIDFLDYDWRLNDLKPRSYSGIPRSVFYSSYSHYCWRIVKRKAI